MLVKNHHHHHHHNEPQEGAGVRHAMMTGPEVLRKHKTVFQVKSARDEYDEEGDDENARDDDEEHDDDKNENHDDDYEAMMIGPEVLRKHKTGFQVKRVLRMILVTTTMHVFDDF